LIEVALPPPERSHPLAVNRVGEDDPPVAPRSTTGVDLVRSFADRLGAVSDTRLAQLLETVLLVIIPQVVTDVQEDAVRLLGGDLPAGSFV
jgi:hypothetical protein